MPKFRTTLPQTKVSQCFSSYLAKSTLQLLIWTWSFLGVATSSGGYGTNENGNAFSDRNQRGVGDSDAQKGIYGDNSVNSGRQPGEFQPASSELPHSVYLRSLCFELTMYHNTPFIVTQITLVHLKVLPQVIPNAAEST